MSSLRAQKLQLPARCAHLCLAAAYISRAELAHVSRTESRAECCMESSPLLRFRLRCVSRSWMLIPHLTPACHDLQASGGDAGGAADARGAAVRAEPCQTRSELTKPSPHRTLNNAGHNSPLHGSRPMLAVAGPSGAGRRLAGVGLLAWPVRIRLGEAPVAARPSQALWGMLVACMHAHHAASDLAAPIQHDARLWPRPWNDGPRLPAAVLSRGRVSILRTHVAVD